MSINYDDFFELKSDSKIKACTVTIYESGRIKIAKTLYDQLNCDYISIRISRDYKKMLLQQSSEGLKLKRDQSTMARQEVEKFNRRKVLFPMVYEMLWDVECCLWKGSLMPPTELIHKSKQKPSLKEII